MYRKSKWFFALTILLFALGMVIVGCSGDESGSNSNEVGPSSGNTNTGNTNTGKEEINNEPEAFEEVTLRMNHPGNTVFLEIFLEKLYEKYPHITVTYPEAWEDPHSRETWDKWILNNEVPDIVTYVPTQGFHILKELELVYPLDELIERHNFDLSRIDQGTIEALRALADGELIGLPQIRGTGYPQYGPLVYNKDIFDMFGVNYPTNGMTWDEIIEKASALTGERDGRDYYGFQFIHTHFLTEHLAYKQPLLDPVTHKPNLVNNDVWRRAFETTERIYSIPGQMTPMNPTSLWGSFAKDRNIAMTIQFPANDLVRWTEEEGTARWGVVAGPNFGDGLLQPVVPSWSMSLTSVTKHPNDAMRILDYWFSDEIQMLHGTHMQNPSRLPVQDPAVIAGVELSDALSEVDWSIFSYHNNGPIPEYSRYQRDAFNLVSDSIGEFIQPDRTKDLTSFLSELEERLEVLVADLIAAEQ